MRISSQDPEVPPFRATLTLGAGRRCQWQQEGSGRLRIPGSSAAEPRSLDGREGVFLHLLRPGGSEDRRLDV